MVIKLFAFIAGGVQRIPIIVYADSIQFLPSTHTHKNKYDRQGVITLTEYHYSRLLNLGTKGAHLCMY